jgi:hypothetical protein
MTTVVTLEDLKRQKRSVLRDGETLSVPLYLMDGVQREVATTPAVRLTDALGRPAGHRPGHAIAPATAQTQLRDAAFEASVERLTNAWKEPVAPVPASPASQRTADAPAKAPDAAAAWAGLVARTRDAWRDAR